MDRKLSEKDIRKKKMSGYLKIGVPAAAIIVLSVFMAAVMRPGIEMDAVDVSDVGRGTLSVSVGATGSVVPFYEETVTSPIASKILEVYRKSGEHVSKGDMILKLDLTTADTDLQADKDALEIQKYKLEQYRTEAAGAIADMEKQVVIDEMRLKRMEALMINEHYLDSIGGSTADMVRQRELDYEVARLQLEQLKLQCENKKKTTESALRVYELEYGIAESKLALRQKEIGDARVLAPFDATLSWVNDQIGSGVAKGSQLAVLSDLSRFKVTAEISDSFIGQFNAGSKVEVKIGGNTLTGTVANVVPSVSNSRITFNVFLDDSSDTSLRPGLKADVYVVTATKEDALKIANRSYYSGPGEYDLWVVDGKYAEKRTVLLGESSSMEVEVLEGLRDGERVIVSNMGAYRTKDRLKIR